MKSFTTWLYGTSQERIEKESHEKFQITEYDGVLWLTCDNTIVCPTHMFNEDPVVALQNIRKYYVGRNTKDL